MKKNRPNINFNFVDFGYLLATFIYYTLRIIPILFIFCSFFGVISYYLNHYIAAQYLYLAAGIIFLIYLTKIQTIEILYCAVYLAVMTVIYEIKDLGYYGFFFDGFKLEHFLSTFVGVVITFTISNWIEILLMRIPFFKHQLLLLKMKENPQLYQQQLQQEQAIKEQEYRQQQNQQMQQHTQQAQQQKTKNVPVRMQPNPNAFTGLIGLGEAINEIKDALELPLKYPHMIQRYGLKPPRGILLYGPPGTGKTSFARASAEYFGCAFYVVNASSLCAGLVGATEENITSLFKEARQNAPSIIFFDEIDAIGQRRDGQNLNRPSDLALNVLLSELDGFHVNESVFVIAATNRPDVLDEALTRPGRLERHIYLGLPGEKARQKLFERYLHGRPLSSDIDYILLAKITDGWSPADIEAACNVAAKTALKRAVAGGVEVITMEDLQRAIGMGSQHARTNL